MRGLMMDEPLVIPRILDRAARWFGEKTVVSRRSDGSIERSDYRNLRERVFRAMGTLRSLGVEPGDRVGTLAWNHLCHLELYFSVPCMGAVLHTINIRLSEDQLIYMIRHAGDRVLFIDASLWPKIAPIADRLDCVRRFVIIDDGEPLPDDAIEYEALLARAEPLADYPKIDERDAAGLCYTSGTTGEPKGSLYSHRSTYLHAMGTCMVDSLGAGERETIMAAVPMFHVNAWGFPYAALMAGSTLVLPGSSLQPGPLAELIESERVTLTAGVPTIWTMMAQYLERRPHDLSSLKTIFVGGAATPYKLIRTYRDKWGIEVVPAWGMTETSPVGAIARRKSFMNDWPTRDDGASPYPTGLPVPGLDARIADEQGQLLPWDGVQIGELEARGPWIASEYYANPEASASFTPDGWFKTGDMASIDPFGYIRIVDRKKDLVKIGGEWISSVDVENAALAHPNLSEAAMVARSDPLRGETPVLFLVADGAPPSAAEVLSLLAKSFARWQLPKPGNVRFVESLPKTAVGKIDKKLIRSQLASPPDSADSSSPSAGVDETRSL